MNTPEEIKLTVKEKYAEIAEQSKAENASSCCGAGSSCGDMDYTIMSDEYVGIGIITVTIIKFGDAACADDAAEFEETAGLFGDGDADQCFAAFADFGAFGDVTQAVEVHVGAAVDGD